MRMISIIFVAVIVVLSSGCATSNYKQTTILPQNANGAFVKGGKQYVPVINNQQKQPAVQQQAVVEKQKCRPMTAQGTEIPAPARKALGVPEFVDCPRGATTQQQMIQPQVAPVAPVAAYTPPPPGYTDRYSRGTPAVGQQVYQDPRGRYMRGNNAAYAAQYAARSLMGNFAVMNSTGYYSFNPGGGGGPSISMNGFPFAGPLGMLLFSRF